MIKLSDILKDVKGLKRSFKISLVSEIIIKIESYMKMDISDRHVVETVNNIIQKEEFSLTEVQENKVIEMVKEYDHSSYHDFIRESIESVLGESNYNGFTIITKKDDDFYLGFAYYTDNGIDSRYFDRKINMDLKLESEIMDDLDKGEKYTRGHHTELDCINDMLFYFDLKQRKEEPEFIPIYKNLFQAIENYDDNRDYLIFRTKEFK